MNNKKLKDYVYIAILIIFYFAILIIKTDNGQYILGSKLDFDCQHYMIPEYFRTLFYENHDLFPDFAFNYGCGVNIYSLSYHGFLNPIVLVSYLLPKISMLDYLIAAMGIVVLSATILFYVFLRKNNYSSLISFICSFMLLTSGPLIFHSNRHVMFIDYFPFLILGLLGTDLYIKKKDSKLLIVSVALIIYISYFYCIPSMISIFIYGLYKYSKINEQKILKFALKYGIRFIIAILIAGILLLPTISVILDSRMDSVGNINNNSLVKPRMFMLYDNYSIGLTFIALVATVIMVFSKRIENRLVSIFLLLICICPIFSYCLNGFMYVEGKTLIPFLPLVLINFADFLEIAFDKLDKKKRIALISYIIFSASLFCIINNLLDGMISKEEINDYFYKNYSEIVKNEDENIYRSNTTGNGYIYTNKVGSISDYKTTMYSSLFNDNYFNAYHYLLKNPVIHYTHMCLCSSNDLLSQMFLGEKYIYTREKYDKMYELINQYEDVNVYKNEYVMPIGYATKYKINEKDFENIKFPDNVINMMGSVITSDKTNKDLYTSNKIDYDYKISDVNNLSYSKEDSLYKILADEDASMKVKIDRELKENEVLYIGFDLQENENQLWVKINDVENTLSSSLWKYYNSHTYFNYFLFDTDLDVEFSEGEYNIENLDVRIIDLDYLKSINKTVDTFKIDKAKTKGDVIEGNINVSEDDSWFVITVPYDKGFTIFVDGEEHNYQKVNQSFIGFEIPKGEHNIRIVYEAPFKKIGAAVSIVGLIALAIVIIYEKKKK